MKNTKRNYKEKLFVKKTEYENNIEECLHYYISIDDAKKILQFPKWKIEKAIDKCEIAAKKEDGIVKVDLFSCWRYIHKYILSKNPSDEWKKIKLKKGEKLIFLNSIGFKFNGLYFITNFGRLGNITTGKFETPDINNKGYECFRFMQGKKTKKEFIQTLVAVAFCPNARELTKEQREVHHIKIGMEFRTDNNVDNLMFTTKSEHHKLHNLYLCGKLDEYAKLIECIKALNVGEVA